MQGVLLLVGTGSWETSAYKLDTSRHPKPWTMSTRSGQVEGALTLTGGPTFHIGSFTLISWALLPPLMRFSLGFLSTALATGGNLSRTPQRQGQLFCKGSTWISVSQRIKELRESRSPVKSRSLWAKITDCLYPRWMVTRLRSPECRLAHGMILLVSPVLFCSTSVVMAGASRKIYKHWRKQLNRYYW